MWNEVDILVTANPNLLENYPSGKILVKFNTDYNKNINCDHSIKSIKELEAKLNEIIQC
jgi:5'(3')-deoxyribonucleotidase